MRARKIINLLAASVIIGFTIGIISSICHIVSQRYISYKMFRLITLTFQKNINASAIYTMVALLALYVLLLILTKKCKFDRKKILRFGVMALVPIAILVIGHRFLKGFSNYTIRTAIYDIFAKSVDLLNGKISFKYFFASLTERAIPIVVLIVSVLVLLLTYHVLRKIKFEVLFNIKDVKYIKGTALTLIVISLLLNLFVIIDRKINMPKGPNVILMVIDTLRADHLGCYGYQRNTTPNIDKLCKDSLLFKNAISAAPWTAPSVSSILTSQYPVVLGYRGRGDELIKIDERFVSLAEIFKDNLYSTKGIISNPHLSYRQGFNQGFDSYDEDNSRDHLHISSPSLTQKAISFIKGHKNDRFFLFIHYFDPHYCFFLHPEYDYFPDYSGYVCSGQPIGKLRERAAKFSPSDIDYLKALYDSEINFTDEHIGRLLQALKELGIYDNTLIVITADHGEEFLERGDHWIGHGDKLYQEQIHVPLLIKLPGAKKPRIIEEYVGLIDLMPTIAELSGLKIPRNYRCHGAMLNLTEERDIKEKPIISETSYRANLQSVVWKNWKLIRDLDIDQTKLFNLKNDPAESEDVAGENEKLLQDINSLLQQWNNAVELETLSAKKPEKADFTREQKIHLKALGYIQ